MNLPIETLAAVGLVVVFAYTVVGLTGFGASMVAMPMLVQLLPLRLALPMMLVYDLVGGIAIGVRNRKSVDRGELLRLVPFMLTGIVLGVTLLVKAPERALLLLLGLFVLAFAGWSLLVRPGRSRIAPHGPHRSERWAASSARCSAPAGRSTRSTSRGASRTRAGCARRSRCFCS